MWNHFYFFFSYLLICTYMLYVGAWSCVNHVIMKIKIKEEEEEEEEEERFDVLIRNELQLLVPHRVYT